MLNFFYRSTVKHGTQNIQNEYHQWLSHSFRVHQIRFRRCFAPDPTGEAYCAPPDPLAGLRGPTSKERKGERKGREERGEKGNGRDPPSQIPGSAPERGHTLIARPDLPETFWC